MSSETKTSKRSWISHTLVHGPTYLASSALFFLMVMTFFDVILRSLFNNPIEAATELTRLLMAVVVFASLPIVTWRGEHIVVDLLDGFFSKGLARIRNILIDGASGILLLWPAYKVIGLAERARSYGDLTEYLEIPQFYIAYFIGAATFLTAGVLICRCLITIFVPSKLEDHHQHPGS